MLFRRRFVQIEHPLVKIELVQTRQRWFAPVPPAEQTLNGWRQISPPLNAIFTLRPAENNSAHWRCMPPSGDLHEDQHQLAAEARNRRAMAPHMCCQFRRLRRGNSPSIIIAAHLTGIERNVIGRGKEIMKVRQRRSNLPPPPFRSTRSPAPARHFRAISAKAFGEVAVRPPGGAPKSHRPKPLPDSYHRS